jgi:hypothetical protein
MSGAMKNNEKEIPELLRDTMKTFNRILVFALRVSAELRGERTTDAGEMASIIHTKMCINAISAERLSEAKFFDHSAIMAVCRMIMEGMTLYCYLHETVESAEWECRDLVLRLHDVTARIKLMRAFQKPEQYKDLLDGRVALRKALEGNAFFKTLSGERRTKLISGDQIYVGGMNAAAVRAGWRQETFLVLYNYLSAHTHSAPMSFSRFKKHNINFTNPSEAQMGMVGVALNVAEFCILRVSMDHLSTSSTVGERFDQKELVEFRDEIQNSTVMTSGPPVS